MRAAEFIMYTYINFITYKDFHSFGEILYRWTIVDRIYVYHPETNETSNEKTSKVKLPSLSLTLPFL